MPAALCRLPHLTRLAIDQGDWFLEGLHEDEEAGLGPALPPAFSSLTWVGGAPAGS